MCVSIDRSFGEEMTTSGFGCRFAAILALITPVFAAAAADLPPLPQGLSAPAKPIQLQAFNLPTAAGGSMKADEFKGKVIIARFWATW
jgi:hypothetical protein